MTLDDFFHQNKRVALGFSGGVDSSYLLCAGLRNNADVRPYFINTAFQPQFELHDALTLVKRLGVELTVIEIDILSFPCVANNPPDRCYHCKTALFSALQKRAKSDGYPLLIDGTNASDDAKDRPGMRALRELSVRSPLRECGLTKGEIRQLSKEAGLFTWNKPAYACLATRMPSGAVIDAETLKRVESAENILFDLGYTDFRVRINHGAARLQLKREQMQDAVLNAENIRKAFNPFFDTVLLDLVGR